MIDIVGRVKFRLSALAEVVGRRRLTDFSGILGANVFNNAVSFVATVVVARSLGTELFGRVGIGVSIVVIGAILVDFGLRVSLLRQYPRMQDEQRRQLEAGTVLLKLAFVALAWILAAPLAEGILLVIPVLTGYAELVRWSLISASLLSLWNTLRSIDQARGAFGAFRNWTAAYAITRAIAFVVLVGAQSVQPTTLILGIYFLPLAFLTAVHALPVLARSFAAAVGSLRRVLPRALAYGLWVGLAGLLYSSLAFLPQFGLSLFSTERQVGLYSAALAFMAVFSMLNQSVRVLVLPDVAALSDEAARIRFRYRARRLAPVFFGGSAALIAVLVLAQALTLGADFFAGVPAFVVMAVGTVIAVYFGLMNTLVHSYGVPHVDAIMNSGRLGTLALILVLIPVNAFGAALSYSVVLVAGELAVYLFIPKYATERGKHNLNESGRWSTSIDTAISDRPPVRPSQMLPHRRKSA